MGRQTVPVDSSAGLGCGGAEHLCFERDVDHVRPGNWTYTGHGRGAYEKIEDMRFVGEGRGSWDLERLPVYGWRCHTCCLCCCGLLLLAIIASLILGILSRNGFGHDAHKDVVSINTPMFDCAVDYFHWETVWTSQKKDWCCAQLGKGCEASSKPFDCDAAFNNWQRAWSEAKKAYCCSAEQRGCPGDDCSEGNQDEWPEAKRTWCCSKHDLGCPKDQYDCRAGVSNWRHGWSESKKYWCCKKYDVACPDSVVYDCNAGIPHEWSSAKQAWCCHHRGRCPSSTYDCSAGFTHWHSRWSRAKADWCCLHEQRGCLHTQTTVVEHVPVPVPVPVHHDVHVVYHDSTADPVPVPVPVHHVHVVYHHSSPDPVPVPVPVPHVIYHNQPVPVPVVMHEPHGYDCWHGSSWSPAKRHYCCSRHHLGCSSNVHVVHVIHHVRGHFDCQAGQSNWQAGWSEAKKHWCCARYMVACEGDSGPMPTVTSSIVHRYEDGDNLAGDGDLADGSVDGESSVDSGDAGAGDLSGDVVEGDSLQGDFTEGDSEGEVTTEDAGETAVSENAELAGDVDSAATDADLGGDEEGSASDTSEHPFLATPHAESADGLETK